MDKSEPTLVPEWLKNSASSTGGGSISHANDHSASRVSRGKSFVNTNGHDFGRQSSFERTKSSYFRRSSSGINSSTFRSYSNSGRNRRDREWERDAYGSRDQERLILEDRRSLEFSESEESSRLNGLRRSQSMISANRGDTWHKKVAPAVTSAGVKSNDGLLLKVSPQRGVNKTTFERDFPSLGAEERTVASDAGRFQSPGLTTAIQSLPIGSSASLGSDKWTSALAEVPLLVGSNGTATSSASQVASSSSTSLASGAAVSLNMAEAVAHGPIRTLTSPELPVGAQKREELAIKQSRQLIPVTPSMPRTSMLNSSDKPKGKASHLQHHTMSSLPISQFPRSVPSFDKASNSGKLHVLTSMREKTGLISGVNNNSSTTSGNRIGNSMPAAFPSASVSAATRSQVNNEVPNRKQVLTVLEKRPTSQAQSRNDFFNLVRKKAMADSSSTTDSDYSPVLGTGDRTAPSLSEKHSEMEPFPTTDAATEASPVRSANHHVDNLSEETAVLTSNGDACFEHKHVINRKKDLCSGPIIPDDEEAAFLRSLGWEENDEQGGLTEEEISSFRMELTKYIESNPPLRILQGTQLRFLLPLDSHKESVISSGLTTHDAKLES